VEDYEKTSAKEVIGTNHSADYPGHSDGWYRRGGYWLYHRAPS